MLNRRDFLNDSSALLAALSGVGLASPELFAQQEPKKRDVNEQLNVACIGVNGQGKAHVSNWAGKQNAVVSIICDVDEAVIGNAMKIAEKGQKRTPKYVKDLRKVFEDPSIDVVSIATPNHWHALAAIWAIQAGKDVYVEKPVSHNVWEGRQIVNAARKHKRIVQTGTQSRSMKGMRQAIDFVHSGKFGKVLVSRGLCYKPRNSIGKVDGPQPIPSSIDYDIWCGPAPKADLLRKRLHYDWHWQWPYGNGDLGNQGIHEMDKARWGLKKNTLPNSVISVGGRFGYVDDGQTANTQLCVFDYGDNQLIFEVRGLKTDALRDCKIGNIFHCEKGVVICPNYYSGVAMTNDGEVVAKFSGGDYADHFGNFAQAVRSRDYKTLNADIEEGHLSSALCHLANVSLLSGTQQPFSKQTNAFGDNKEAAESFERMQQHLKSNMVPLDSTNYSLGPKLEIDTKTETFTNNKEANRLLTREYRKPFVVPEKV
ncbi:MAG: Gfo/Idh/MocA family protein [Gemmataceae bacterium]